MIVNNNYSVELLTKKIDIDKTSKEEIRKLNEELKLNNQGSKNVLGEEDFLKILTTQLKTQDPTNPVDDKTFISQMAQLTTLRELNSLNNNILSLVSQNAINSSLSMISKVIDWIDGDTGNSFSDKVVGVRLNENGEVFLKTEKGYLVSIKSILEVK
ncbi:MAG: flagellar hook capping FlgD N-terminal domain-containing protein [Brevinematia bacterium]